MLRFLKMLVSTAAVLVLAVGPALAQTAPSPMLREAHAGTQENFQEMLRDPGKSYMVLPSCFPREPGPRTPPHRHSPILPSPEN